MANSTREASTIYLSLDKKYRSHLEIVGLILDVIKYNDVARYYLMKYTGINYSQLKKYLDLLGKIGFIDLSIKDGKILYKASGKGLAFLRQYNVLRDMLLSASSQNKPANMVYSYIASKT